MDILTPRGQQYVEHERRVIERMRSYFTDCAIYHTPINAPASLDIIVTRNGRLVAVAEIKCRNNSLDEFNRFGSLILTWTKVQALVDVATALYVPGFVVLYSIPDDEVLIANAVYRDGTIAPGIVKEHTVTQRTCNGGEVTRLNGYLPIDMFRFFEPNLF